ncbi:hypothetical protein WN943_022204 [Citrus x changshan-huyou]
MDYFTHSSSSFLRFTWDSFHLRQIEEPFAKRNTVNLFVSSFLRFFVSSLPKNSLLSFLDSSALLFHFHSCSKSQSLPPAKYDGFLYANHPIDSDTIVIEAFFDPVCPDSKDAWPPLKQALQHYAPHVSLVVHLLLLP